MLLETGDIQNIQTFLKDNESIEETIKRKLLNRVEDLKKERQKLREQEIKLRELEATKKKQQTKKQQIKKYIEIIVNPNIKEQDITNIFRKKLQLFQGIEHVDYISPEQKRLFQQKLNKYRQEGFRDRIRRASGNIDDLTKLKQKAPSDAMRELIQASLEKEKRKNTQRETNAKKREATHLLRTGSNKEIQKFIQDNKSNEILKQQINKLEQKLKTQAALDEAIEKATRANKQKATQLLNTGTIQEIQKFIQDNKSNEKLSDKILLLRTKLATVLLQTGGNREIQRFIRDNESNDMLSEQILLLKRKLATVLLQTGSNKEIQRFIQDNQVNDMLSDQIQQLKKAIIKNKYKTHISNFRKEGSRNNIETIYANTVGNNQIEPLDRIQNIQNQIRLAHDIYRLSRDFTLTQDEDRKKELYNEMFSRVYSDGKDPSESAILFNNANMANDENFSNFLQFFVKNYQDEVSKNSDKFIQENHDLSKQYEFICKTTQYTNFVEAKTLEARTNKKALFPFINDEKLVEHFSDIFIRILHAKTELIRLVFGKINKDIMNYMFVLYFFESEDVTKDKKEVQDIIIALGISNDKFKIQQLLYFINCKFYPNTKIYIDSKKYAVFGDVKARTKAKATTRSK